MNQSQWNWLKDVEHKVSRGILADWKDTVKELIALARQQDIQQHKADQVLHREQLGRIKAEKEVSRLREGLTKAQEIVQEMQVQMERGTRD